MGVDGYGYGLLSVPRPPMGMRPKRRKGTEKVTTLGVMSRMTITSSGLGGMSLDDMAWVEVVIATATPAKMRPPAMIFRLVSRFLRKGVDDDDVARVLALCDGMEGIELWLKRTGRW